MSNTLALSKTGSSLFIIKKRLRPSVSDYSAFLTCLHEFTARYLFAYPLDSPEHQPKDPALVSEPIPATYQFALTGSH